MGVVRGCGLVVLAVLALAACGAGQRTVTVDGHTYTSTGSIVGVNVNNTGQTGRYGWWSYPPLSSTRYSPNQAAVTVPAGLSRSQIQAFKTGEAVVGESGCLACHVIGDNGNNGPGPPLTQIGSRMSRSAITHSLIMPTAPMPSFQGLRQQAPAKFRALVAFLTELR